MALDKPLDQLGEHCGLGHCGSGPSLDPVLFPLLLPWTRGAETSAKS